MTFTPEQVKSYKDGDYSCPYCGATSRLAINNPVFDRSKDNIIVKVDCYGCGQSFAEVYSLTRLESVVA